MGGEPERLGRVWSGTEVVSGTVRDEDLISAFEMVLMRAGVGFRRPSAVRGLMAGQTDLLDSGLEEVDDYIADLFDQLNDIAPEGCYFGAHWGDGACFGFWPDVEE